MILLFEASDLGKARAFTSSADLRQKMQEAGVIDQPDIYFLTQGGAVKHQLNTGGVYP